MLQRFDNRQTAIPRHRDPFLFSCFPDSVPDLEHRPGPLKKKAEMCVGNRSAGSGNPRSLIDSTDYQSLDARR